MITSCTPVFCGGLKVECGESLADMYQLVGLQRQAPLGMVLDILHTLACHFSITHRIASVAGLEVQIEPL